MEQTHLSNGTVGGISSIRSEYVRAYVCSTDSPRAQVLDFQAPSWGREEPTVAPATDCGFADAELHRERRAAVAVDEGMQCFHGVKFSPAKLLAQALGSKHLNPIRTVVPYTSRMNTPWQVKAKDRMRELRITQNHLAEKLEVTKGTISNWFSGRNQPPLSKLRRLAQVIDISFADLVSEDDAICRNLWELDILRTLRAIPQDQQGNARVLIDTLAKTLAALPSSPPP